MKTKSFTSILCILLVVCMSGFVSDLMAAATGKIVGQVIANDTG